MRIPQIASRSRQLGFITPAVLLGSRYRADSALFDGATDWLTRGGDLTGTADGKQGTISAWIRIDGGDGTIRRFFRSDTVLGGAAAPRLFVGVNNSNIIDFGALNAAGATILDIKTTGTYLAGATWRHVLASWDLGTAGARFIYINDVADITVTTFTNDNIDYTVGDWSIGARPDGSQKFFGCIFDFWFNPTFMDLSVVSNRRKFITEAGKPGSLGSIGQNPISGTPLVYQHLIKGASANSFATNLGAGGGFTVNGALTTGSSSPTD